MILMPMSNVQSSVCCVVEVSCEASLGFKQKVTLVVYRVVCATVNRRATPQIEPGT